jgi:hypothetical protein
MKTSALLTLVLGAGLLTGTAVAEAEAFETADDADRALERALTRESALVLPRGMYEVELGLEYAYRGSDALELIDVAGQTQVARQAVRQDRLAAHLGVRAGLPWGMSGEVRLPGVLVRDEVIVGADQDRATELGLGDVEVALTKQLAVDRPGRPGALVSMSWLIPTGDFQLGEPTPGGGFHAFQGAATGVMRQDPLVFFGTLSYTFVGERTHDGLAIDPGSRIGLRLGGLLAVSPRTSVRGAFQMSFRGRTEVNGSEVPGSDAVFGTLEIGLSTLLTPTSLLAIQLGIGVTDDAPDFSISASLPTRYHRNR